MIDNLGLREFVGKGLAAIRAGVVQFKDARKTDIKPWYYRDLQKAIAAKNHQIAKMRKGVELFSLQGICKIDLFLLSIDR